MRNAPNILCVTDVIANAKTTQAGLPDGRWVPARSMGYYSIGNRLRAAWLVFTGKADALATDEERAQHIATLRGLT